ncbi:MAG: biopolymer transporter ExbD, partial [Bacteroidales bacterium]|nr:biopolymer transporter ExbD [Bacteroidales bacterium]
QKGKTKKLSTRVDLTPMVDLAFLLITFFMLTTSMIKPQTMEISMPTKENLDEKEQPKIKASRAITIIIGGQDSVFYYLGTRENNIDPEVVLSDYSPAGLRKILLQKNAEAVLKIMELKKKKENRQLKEEDYKEKVREIKSAKNAPVVLIKALDESTYKNLVDVLDEMQICNIGRYAIVDISPFDKELLAKYKKTKI